jgi:hypothetical protein
MIGPRMAARRNLFFSCLRLNLSGKIAASISLSKGILTEAEMIEGRGDKEADRPKDRLRDVERLNERETISGRKRKRVRETKILKVKSFM